MACFLKSSVLRLLKHNTVCSSTAAPSPFSYLLPTTFHLRHYSEGSLACTNDLNKSVERIRNIWISGLMYPKEMRLKAISGLMYPTEMPLKARLLLYAGRVKEMHEETRYFGYFPLTNFYREFVQFALTYCSWKDYQINTIDTYTHKYSGFTVDLQRVLRVLDGAVLVLCSVLGVERESKTMDEHMKAYEIPRLVFIDKLDKKGANPWEVLNQARSKLGHHSAAIQVPIGLEDDFKGLVDLVQFKAYTFHDENVVVEEIPAEMEALVLDKRHELIKTVSEVDDKLAEAFHSDKSISSVELEEAVRRATIARKFIPVFMGSAFKKGPQPLLDGVLSYLPCPVEVSKYALDQDKNGEKVELSGSPNGPLVALAFKPQGEMFEFGYTFLRINEGVLRKGDFILNVSTGKKNRVRSLFLPDGKDSLNYENREVWLYYESEIQEAHAGQIVAVFYDDYDGYASGETITDGSVRYLMPPPANLPAPVTE